MVSDTSNKDILYVLLEEIILESFFVIFMTISILNKRRQNKCKRGITYSMIERLSGQAVNLVLLAVLRLHSVLLRNQSPFQMIAQIPDGNGLRHRSAFVDCIDDTYMNVHVPEADKGRYRTRKGTISTNVLAACDRNCMFTYILPGWEGSASDARVLRDSVSRVHGLKVPIVDPDEALFDTTEDGPDDSAEIPDIISNIESTTEWSGWRDTLAQEMFQEFMDGV
ncbi:hypothetical protein ACS0TY_031188 [Phlomoides rotata]